MDKYAISAIRAKYNGTTYEFPLGVKADNVVTNSTKRFTSDAEINALKVTVDSALSNTSKNPVQNKVIAQKLETIEELMGGKADVLTVSRTVWVSESGDDTAGDGTETNPWRTIQRALDNVPIINGNAEYFVNVQAGSYPGFDANNCSARLVLQGDVTIQNDNRTYAIFVNNSIIAIMGNGHTLSVTEITGGHGIYIQNSGVINTYQLVLKITGTTTDKGYGIVVVSNGGFSHPNSDINFSNLKVAMSIELNARFHAETVSGSNIGTGIVAKAGGIVTYETNEIEATTAVQTASGGRIYGGEQET